jgi:acid stress-induced BolA-like protein IbaG/YrbA
MEDEEIITRIQDVYPDAVIEVDGEDCSFEIRVSSKAFAGMRPLQRQQSILSIFSAELQSGKLHALGVKVKTPEEWEKTPSNLVQISL